MVKTVNLALQGGGSHGAFTWGVLDRVLEDERIAIEAISGTSAGAMNAVALANGMRLGGPNGAKAALEEFWRRVATIGRFGPFPRTPIDRLTAGWNLDTSPAFLGFDILSRLLSPYQFNPFDWNPLRTVLTEQINFTALRTDCRPQVFVTATSVLSGKTRVFKPAELVPGTAHALAEIIGECDDLPIEIAGHTDSQGREEMNEQLSLDRARAVLDELRLRRVLTSTLKARGYGESRPIADNDTEAGRETNRRIEFRLIRPDSAVTQDFVPSRVNALVEPSGMISSVYCG